MGRLRRGGWERNKGTREKHVNNQGEKKIYHRKTSRTSRYDGNFEPHQLISAQSKYLSTNSGL